MIEFVPFKVEHLWEFEPAERNGREKQEALAQTAEGHQFAFTALRGSEVLGCGGLYPIHENRLIAWTSVSKKAPAATAVRLLRKYLDGQDAKRIETTVDIDDNLCHKWVRVLGFEPEGPPMKYFNRDGTAAQLYVRYNHGT